MWRHYTPKRIVHVQRLRLLDAVLLLLLVPPWVLCFALYVNKMAHGQLARIPLLVAFPEQTDGYPTISGFLPGSDAEAAGLQIGDRLLQAGAADLKGVGPFGFLARLHEHVDAERRLPIMIARDEDSSSVVLPLDPFAFPWRTLPITLGFAAAAVLVLLRRPGLPAARAFLVAGMAYSFHWLFFPGGPRWQTYAWIAVFLASSVVVFPLFLRVILLLPEELAPEGKRGPWWPWAFIVFAPSISSRVFGTPFSHAVGMRLEMLVTAVFVAVLLAVLTRNFLRAGPLGRRQLKWILYGLYIGTVPVLAVDAVIGVLPSLWWCHEVATLSVAFIPFCVFLAVVRFNLFDVDRLIGATTTYSLLALVFGLGGLLLGPRLSQAASASVGVTPLVGQTVLSVLLLGALFPLHWFLRSRIDRWFFPERYALRQGVTQLLQELDARPEPQPPFALVGERLAGLLHAENCVIYEKKGERYLPVFTHGGVAPAAFSARSALVNTFRFFSGNDERRQRAARAYLSAEERAVFTNLRAALVLPVSHEDIPPAFLCFGPKRSGDVYTATDVTLLSQVAVQLMKPSPSAA